MEPNFDGLADPFDANTNVIESIFDTHAAAGTYWNSKCVFLSKNSSVRSLIVLSVGLKNDDGVNLVDLEIDPWKSLPANSTKPKKEDYANKICLCYVEENLRVTANMKREPKPKQWDRKKMLTWHQDHPITNLTDFQFIKNTVKIRREAADWINAARLLEMDASDKAVQAWYGPLPMLPLIMALVHSDEIRSAYVKWNDTSNERIVLDNQKSVEKRATTVWELLSSLWNVANFSPVTEYIDGLYLDLTHTISIPHSRVSTLSPATPDKVQEKHPQWLFLFILSFKNGSSVGRETVALTSTTIKMRYLDCSIIALVEPLTQGWLFLAIIHLIFCTYGRCFISINYYPQHLVSWHEDVCKEWWKRCPFGDK
jgi:hypothetical protein